MTFPAIDICHRTGTIGIDIRRDLYLRFQAQTFSCYAFAKKNAQAANIPR